MTALLKSLKRSFHVSLFLDLIVKWNDRVIKIIEAVISCVFVFRFNCQMECVLEIYFGSYAQVK